LWRGQLGPEESPHVAGGLYGRSFRGYQQSLAGYGQKLATALDCLLCFRLFRLDRVEIYHLRHHKRVDHELAISFDYSHVSFGQGSEKLEQSLGRG